MFVSVLLLVRRRATSLPDRYRRTRVLALLGSATGIAKHAFEARTRNRRPVSMALALYWHIDDAKAGAGARM